MAVDLLEPKLIKSPNANSGDHGSFTLEEPFQFEQCRERFAAVFKETTKGFYFKHPQHKGTHIAEFLTKIEEFLKLPQHSKFALSNRRTILWVEPSRFWRQCAMRRSLLTGLLRCGIEYEPEKDNFEEALLTDNTRSHLSRTRPALLRFLCGYTEYTGPEITGSATLVTQGWRFMFENKDIKTIRQMLKHPDGKRPRINPAKLDLSETLWA